MTGTKARILKTGIKYFGEIPYEKVLIEDITSAAKVNVSAVSYYFGGKENLYKEVINILNKHVIDELSKIDLTLLEKANLDEAKVMIIHIVDTFHGLFVSKNGQSRVNIFLKEITSAANNEIKSLFNRHVEFSFKFLKRALTIYYCDKLGISEDLIEFRIVVFFSLLKDLATNHQKPEKN